MRMDWAALPRTGAVLDAARAQTPWPRALDAAHALGMDGLLRQRALSAGERLEDAARWRQHLMGIIWRRAQLEQVLQALQTRDVQALVLKGEPLAVILYGATHSAARRSGDLDLLIRPEEARAAGDALRTLGYSPMFADHPEPWLYNQWAWQRPGRDDAVVELHWALAAPQVPQPRACELIARAQRVRCGALEVRALSDADQLLHACYHFHHHAGVLKALLDVASWCDRFGAGAAPSLAIDEASRLGVRGLVAWPVGAIGALSAQERWPWEVQIATRSTKRSRALAAWSARATRGALGGAQVEEGASGFKTGKVAQAQVVAWRLGATIALDRSQDSARAAIFEVLRSPSAHAAARGASAPKARDWLATIARPGVMALKQARAWASVRED